MPFKDRDLPADEQILDAVRVKALEKVCDHARRAEQANASASPNCNATVHAE